MSDITAEIFSEIVIHAQLSEYVPSPQPSGEAIITGEFGNIDTIESVPIISTVSENIKDMQGTPPLQFTSNGENLDNYIIYGNSDGVGDYVGNLFNTTLEQGSINSEGEEYDRNDRLRSAGFIPMSVGKYRLSVQKAETASNLSMYVILSLYDDSGTYIGDADDTWQSLPYQFTISQACKAKALFCYTDYTTDIPPSHISDLHIVPTGVDAPTVTDGYKIPITVGNSTVNLLIDKPLGVGDGISLADTGVNISTVSGSNTLSVETYVSPTVYIRYRS